MRSGAATLEGVRPLPVRWSIVVPAPGERPLRPRNLLGHSQPGKQPEVPAGDGKAEG